jgi:ABC-2 type transport system permease protein
MRLRWWGGTRLVAARAMSEGIASRSWRVVTVLLLLVGVAAVVVPRLLGTSGTEYTLATVGPAPPALVAQLEASAKAGDFTVHYNTVPDGAAVSKAVRDGKADAGLVVTGTTEQLFVRGSDFGPFPTLVSGAARAKGVVDALAASGLSPEQIAALQAVPAPKQVVVGPATDPKRAGVGFVVGIVLYLALILAGTSIATAVATEKSTRISEVLLAVLRPTQLLVGTVLGVGLLALLQISAVAIPAGVSLWTSHSSQLPTGAGPDIALAVAWFVLGLAVYAFLFAGLAALVDKVTEVNSAILPVNALLIGSYLIAISVVVGAPDGAVAVAASMFPLSAPLVMPVRWASGQVPGWELALSMTLTLATAVVLARLASIIYQRGVVRTGQRLKLRDVLHT